ncbi:hypothetical protein CK228_24585 [Mesorhizobium sp. WSM4312]|nr:hypothetical protein CK228_24585 [Mesorhizobium sp. WSM4312]PBC20083.1 hypothetical protein CK226_25270 [Mesorhizobium sp. WSM4311]TRC75272.1 hypothetical protein FJV80_28265 [Mesorhizobium sp. WSM4310]TRC77921.1 hypothetical protein FJV81_09850 [Mesorhizobium sp. WSM4315]TRC78685.1 hypothetical protein FJV83_30050 [Mesorhizobium sp. WSM4307]TRC95934.1 hypothetical protein FJV82_27595 [Mesorhizobium sp. WSM4305]
MTRRLMDEERFERADREAKPLVEAETKARKAKTARLRELRLSAQPTEKSAPVKRRRPPAKKPSPKIIEVD